MAVEFYADAAPDGMVHVYINDGGDVALPLQTPARTHGTPLYFASVAAIEGTYERGSSARADVLEWINVDDVRGSAMVNATRAAAQATAAMVPLTAPERNALATIAYGITSRARSTTKAGLIARSFMSPDGKITLAGKGAWAVLA